MILEVIALASCLSCSLAQLNVAESFRETILLTTSAVETGAGTPGALAASDAVGSASLLYDGDSGVLSYTINFQDMSGPPTIAHFHGPARINANAGVQLEIPVPPGLGSTGVLDGRVQVDIGSQMHIDVLSGLWYINIHSDVYPAGELRGQVNQQGLGIPESTILVDRAIVTLGVEQTNPLVNQLLDSSGEIELELSRTDPPILSWSLTFAQLDSSTMFAHFHGPAPLGQNAGVIQSISEIPFASPHMGQIQISDDFRDQLLAGQVYVNVHTTTNPNGEIRGQVVGFQEAFVPGNVGAASALQSSSMTVLLAAAASAVVVVS